MGKQDQEPTVFSALTQTRRQREIIEIVLQNGWDYMRRLLTGGRPDSPQLPPPEVFRNILVDLGPVYVKLGQLLSTRPDLLPASYIEALTTLQAKVPPVPWVEVETVIRRQLSQSLEETFETINPEPVAAGSIAQTHRATLKTGQDVALKIQRPGIEATINQDIALLQGLAILVSTTEFGKLYDLVSLANEFATALRAELDFTKEAGYTDLLRQNLAKGRWFDPANLVVPKVYWEVTTEKLLVLEWLNGVPLLLHDFSQPVEATQNGAEGKPELSGKEVATLLTRSFFQQICIDGFFHADPHPGNLFYLKSNQIALLDCGMMGRLDPRTQQILIELLLAIANLDIQRCTQLTLQLSPSSKPIDLPRLESEFDRLLRKYYSLTISEVNFSYLFYEVLETARNNRIRVPGNLGLCAKALANLEGVARQLDPEYNLLDQVKPLMADVFRKQLFGESVVPTLLRTALDLKNLSLQSPRQVELLLDRVTSETLRWNLTLQDLDGVRRSLDDSANRLSFSILVGSLIMGAAIVSSKAQVSQVYWISDVLFATASILGLWLIVSILRSGRLR